MKKLIYSIMALAALTSCVKNEFDTRAEYPIDLSVTFETKAGGSDATTEPIVNSMRVLIFYGDAQTQPVTKAEGTLLLNTFYAFGFNTVKGTGKYTVNLANQIVLPQSDCRDYNVYVILNEEGYQLSGVDLHTTLGNFEGTEDDLQTTLNTPADYTTVLKNVDEPAFLISGRKAVKFGSGELGSVKPIEIAAGKGTSSTIDDYNRGRSMAQIVINKITSEPAPGEDDYTSSDVPKIFVKSVTLENIPNTIAWSDEDGSTDGTAATKMASQPVGSANTDGYYTREWYGHVTRTITNLWAQKVQYTDAKLYRTDDNSSDPNKKKWSFFVKPYRTGGATDNTHTNPYVFQYAKGGDADAKYNAFKAFEKIPDPALSNTIMDNIFDAMQDGVPDMSENITYTSYEVTGVQKETKGVNTKTSIGRVTLSNDEYWTVRLGDKFYVPENIQSAATNATCLHVTLAIANPKFSFRFDSEDETKFRVCTEDCASMGKNDYKHLDNFIDPTTLPSPSSLPNESTLTYNYYVDYTQIKYDKGEATKTDMSQAINAINEKWLKAYGHIAYADDASKIIEYQDSWYNNKGEITIPNDFVETNEHGFHAYIDGFNRKSNAVQTGNLVVNETLAKQGANFDWNVNASTQVYDFYIPVNNNIDNNGDYSVHRNTKYTVTLYVNAATYTSMSTSSLSTKTGESAPFSITAKVTTETVSDYEE